MQVGAPLWNLGYSLYGLLLENAPTHEWIATRLAKENCRSPYIGARILAEEGARALKVAPFPLELTFLIAGWARLEGAAFLVPHFLLITNRYDDGGKQRD